MSDKENNPSTRFSDKELEADPSRFMAPEIEGLSGSSDSDVIGTLQGFMKDFEGVEDKDEKDGSKATTVDEEEESEEESESESSEDEGEDDGSSDESEEEQDADDDFMLEVETPDGVEEVSPDEWRNGYLRHKDYTKKTQELSSERKKYQGALVEAQETLQKTRDTYEAIVGIADQDLKAYEDVNWERLRVEDEDEYNEKRLGYFEAKERADKLRKEFGSIEQNMTEQQRKFAEEVARESMEVLPTLIPEWDGQEGARRVMSDIAKFAKESGFTDEEVGSLIDHRVINLAYKAMKYDALKDTKKSAEEKREKPKIRRVPKSKAKDKSVKNSKRSKLNKAAQPGASDRDILEGLKELDL